MKPITMPILQIMRELQEEEKTKKEQKVKKEVRHATKSLCVMRSRP